TANHEIKQPLTLINLSVSAIKRELTKDDLNRDAILKRVDIIDNAAKSIIQILEKLSSIKKPKFTDYVNNTQMIDINDENNKDR
ncbi:MAG TPA: response regulator, partial [Melioribacteraceae bacterium]|nr:response regulator [Melioribacteraceae bacterium]